MAAPSNVCPAHTWMFAARTHTHVCTPQSHVCSPHPHVCSAHTDACYIDRWFLNVRDEDVLLMSRSCGEPRCRYTGKTGYPSSTKLEPKNHCLSAANSANCPATVETAWGTSPPTTRPCRQTDNPVRLFPIQIRRNYPTASEAGVHGHRGPKNGEAMLDKIHEALIYLAEVRQSKTRQTDVR